MFRVRRDLQWEMGLSTTRGAVAACFWEKARPGEAMKEMIKWVNQTEPLQLIFCQSRLKHRGIVLLSYFEDLFSRADIFSGHHVGAELGNMMDLPVILQGRHSKLVYINQCVQSPVVTCCQRQGYIHHPLNQEKQWWQVRDIGFCPKWHHSVYIVHYFRPGTIGNTVSLGMQPITLSLYSTKSDMLFLRHMTADLNGTSAYLSNLECMSKSSILMMRLSSLWSGLKLEKMLSC